MDELIGTIHSLIGIGVSVVLVMESYVSNILLYACYLTKSKGEIDHLLEVKHYILFQKGHTILVISFILSILTFLYTFQYIRDSWDHLADQDWAAGTGEFCYCSGSILLPSHWWIWVRGSGSATWLHIGVLKNLWSRTSSQTSAIRISGGWDPGTSVFFFSFFFFQIFTSF